jgi:hypothetical protein
MAFNIEKAEARRLLGALEDGKLGATDTFQLVKKADPTLIYFVFAWLRARYPSSHPASDAVLGRMGELCSRYPKAARMAQDGKDDPLVEWFEDAYGYRDFRAAEFIELVVEKLEG